MKVIVINPGVNRARKPLQRPGGPISIAEFLIEKGIRCQFKELCGVRITKKSISQIALTGPYDFLLLSIMGGEFVERAVKIAKLWKYTSPDTVIIAGGQFITNHLAPRPSLWKGLPINIFVKGFGEWIILDILNSHQDPSDEPVLIEGRLEKLDELPGPCKYLTPVDYISPLDGYLPGKRTFQITTSRGCPYRCIFCHQNTVKNGKSFSGMSPERMIEECKRLVRDYRIGGFYFVDDLLSADIKRLHRFCELKSNSPLLCKVPFFGDFRTTDFSRRRVDPGLLVKSGLRHVYIGFESGSDRILDKIGKDASADDHIQAIQLLKRYGVRITGSFVIGFPFETKNDLIETRDFLISQKMDYSEIHINGATWDNLDKEVSADETLADLIHLSHWGKLPLQSPPDITKLRKELLRLQKRPGFEIASILKMMAKTT